MGTAGSSLWWGLINRFGRGDRFDLGFADGFGLGRRDLSLFLWWLGRRRNEVRISIGLMCGFSESQVKGSEKRQFSFADRTSAPKLGAHDIKLEKTGVEKCCARRESRESGEGLRAVFEDLEQIGEDRVVHDLLILTFVPIDGFFSLFGCNQSFEYVLRQPLAVPLLAVNLLETLPNRQPQITENLGDDAVRVYVLFQPLHISWTPGIDTRSKNPRLSRCWPACLTSVRLRFGIEGTKLSVGAHRKTTMVR